MKNQITALGFPLAGKTSYFNTINHYKDPLLTTPTIGTILYTCKCNDISFNIYVTSGLERNGQYQLALFVRKAKIVCFFYDITNINGLEEVNRALQISNDNNSSYIRYIIGNKVDLERYRIVSYQEGEQNAKMHEAFFYEVSCLTQKGVFESFYLMYLLYKEKMLNEEKKKHLFIIGNNNNHTKKCILF